MRDVVGKYQFREDQCREMTKHGFWPKSYHGGYPPPPSKFTVDEVVRMAETGVLGEDDRVELIDGVLVEMARTGRPHGHRTHWVARVFGRKVPENVEVSVQSTVRLNDWTAPEPDIALLTPEASQDKVNLPGPRDILLVVEIADTTVATDRTNKARLYARSGIPELWIFILPSDEIEVYRTPTPRGYKRVQRYRRGDTLTVEALPGIQFPVDELLQ